ncbi:LacI family DNA-binding transcriptional regulator [Goodfellowiella coeruleoviolacea]|uniref:Transcriptional regulator, LacI family n=1 Tax=Goodfellowiella coeruleoviolacea TaxID=334858 RepID=A0AAE3G9U9_9PSEU|nr:LacI family DNA-binding transcriptional regulator [Goodfellowiella coeruleoviolacea]MCP2164170.1 transcriptional regulator, LacI family [Goodfellowiella coeruleoviolacea]
MTTIRELAQLCGVSLATVSRVFNKPDSVSPKTRERVERMARELDYRPNESARTLATGRSTMVGLVWDTDHRRSGWRHPFLQDLLIGLKSALSAHGYHLLMLATGEAAHHRQVGASLADPVGYVDTVRRHDLAGVVLIDSGSDAEAFALFAQSGLPCVAIDVAVDGPRATYVTSANAEGAGQAVRHLLGLGHRRIATIAGPARTRPGADRLAGYRAALAEAGVPVREDYVAEGDFYRASGHSAMRKLLALPEPPTAVFAAGDEMAVGALLAARQAGCRVPDDVALVGFDDIEVAALVEPALTTVAQDKSGFGRAAAAAVMAMVEGGKAAPTPAPVELATTLVVRDSCGAAAPR